MKVLKLICINSLVFLLLIEIVGYLKQSDLEEQIKEGLETLGYREIHLQEVRDTRRVTHPFFGYIARGEKDFETPRNFDVDLKGDEFRVGLFGGSTAELLFNYWSREGQLHFASSVSQLTGVAPNKVRLVTFAIGGYKQPTQFSQAALYGPNLDMAINLDGYNEITYGFGATYPFYYPLHYMTFPFYSSPEALPYVVAMREHFSAVEWLLPLRQGLNGWKGFQFLLGLNILRHMKQFELMYSRTRQFTRPFYEDHQRETGWRRARFWLRMSCAQQNQLSQLNVPSFYFIQPIPHLENAKPLSQEEVEMIQNHQGTQSITKEYNLVMAKVKSFKGGRFGLNLIDATAAFKDHTETLYLDGCCHPNQQGLKILTDFIFSELKKRGLESHSTPLCDLKELIGEAATF